jgi:hypothetical protein
LSRLIVMAYPSAHAQKSGILGSMRDVIAAAGSAITSVIRVQKSFSLPAGVLRA